MRREFESLAMGRVIPLHRDATRVQVVDYRSLSCELSRRLEIERAQIARLQVEVTILSSVSIVALVALVAAAWGML